VAAITSVAARKPRTADSAAARRDVDDRRRTGRLRSRARVRRHGRDDARALERGRARLEQQHIASDNTTALSYVRRQGGRLHHLARAAEPLTRAVHRWRVHLTTSHIPGEENGVADELSRRQHDRHDWALHPDAFALVERHYGAVEFDWFASSANAKHRRYATRRPDARAERVGAFRADWSQVAHNYWCPPTPLLARTVRKIADDGAHGVIIVPRWLAQVWWAPLARMMRATPLLLNSHVARPIVPSRAGHPMQNGVDPPMLAVLV